MQLKICMLKHQCSNGCSSCFLSHPPTPLFYQVDKQFLVVEHYGMQFCFILCWIGLPSVIRQAYKLFKQCCVRDSMDRLFNSISEAKRIHQSQLFIFQAIAWKNGLINDVYFITTLFNNCLLLFFHHLINYFHQNLSSFALCMWYRKNI